MKFLYSPALRRPPWVPWGPAAPGVPWVPGARPPAGPPTRLPAGPPGPRAPGGQPVPLARRGHGHPCYRGTRFPERENRTITSVDLFSQIYFN